MTRLRPPVRSITVMLSEDFFQIRLRRADGGDVVVFDKEVEHVRRYEGRERRAEQDVLYSEVEQRQQDADGLLFIP